MQRVLVKQTIKSFDDTCDICDPQYCLPDAYNYCNPDENEDGGCDPSEDDE